MLPLIGYLPRCGHNGVYRTQCANLAFIKGVATRGCFGMNGRKISADGGTWPGMGTKALQLRVMPITSRLPAQYGASQ